jgi:transposase
MAEEITVTTESVDDIPLLIEWMEQMGLITLINETFPPHGNWQGLDPGRLLVGWLAHILSQADHRLNQVQDWASKRLETLSGCLGVAVRALDFSDDRLASILDALGDEERWAAFEAALNRRTLRVYALQAERVRVDTTTASGYWAVSEDGLFQLGHSKEQRPDLPQLKIVLATLDPLGMPVAVQVVAGDKADDPLYLPAIEQVRIGLERRGLLYVGDSKMMALSTRAWLQSGQDYYLGPLSALQMPPETLAKALERVWSGEQPLITVERKNAEGKTEKIAEGYEVEIKLTAVVDGQEVSWRERRLFVHSFRHAQAAETALRKRLENATQALQALNERKQGKKRRTDKAALEQEVASLLKQHQVAGLLEVQVPDEVHERPVRKYGERAAEIRQEHHLSVSVKRNEAAIEQTVRLLGWRVYATNARPEMLSLEQAVLAYREEYLVERNFGRLKGKPLSLTPMYLQDDRRASGLTHLLSIGLRVLALIEHVARSQLKKAQEKLSGLYAGNAKRATECPTAEMLLRAFKDIFLNFVQIDGRSYRYTTPLSELQRKILDLLNIPSSIYSVLACNSSIPP